MSESVFATSKLRSTIDRLVVCASIDGASQLLHKPHVCVRKVKDWHSTEGVEKGYLLRTPEALRVSIYVRDSLGNDHSPICIPTRTDQPAAQQSSARHDSQDRGDKCLPTQNRPFASYGQISNGPSQVHQMAEHTGQTPPGSSFQMHHQSPPAQQAQSKGIIPQRW